MFDVCGTTGVSISGKKLASHFYANNQRWYCDRSRYAASMRRPALLRSMFLKSHISQDWQDMLDIMFWDTEMLCMEQFHVRGCGTTGVLDVLHDLGVYLSLYPFYANTNDGIVVGPRMASTYMRSSAHLKSVVLKIAAKLR